MNDSELLELAAKAAGYEVEWVRNSGCHYRCEAEESREQWCPLDDDGDALRLAVVVGIDVDQYGDRVETWKAGLEGFIVEPYSGDKYATTRRAIVRAAAQIGQSM